MWITLCREFPHIPTAQHQLAFLQKSDGRPIAEVAAFTPTAHFNSSSSAFASFRSAVSTPSVNRSWTGAGQRRPSVGGLMLARAVADPALSDQILEAARAAARGLAGGARSG